MATYAQQAKDSSGTSYNHNNNSSSDGSKKEEFRKYLEKSGVLDALTKVLVGLYEEPERPTNAIDYIKRYLGAPKNVDVLGLQKENEQLRRQVAALMAETAEKSQTNSSSSSDSKTTSP